ncbi:MAG TPA: DUF3795 domain-containing protein [Candidatus Bathyarchaeota archaeon]|nr:DUF3795 domain-containing protein [Candidatus Bathyarchaeota archaeon]
MKHEVREKGVRMAYCKGCRPRDKRCAFLKKRCDLLLNKKVEYCYECEEFPCENLKHIDKRYQTLYHMSLIDNLKFIKAHDLAKFLEHQKNKWQCPDCGDVICCHNGICFSCGLEKLKKKKKIYRWED